MKGLTYRWAVRRRLLVQGIVQGIGFRPWIHQLAAAHGLRGYVCNSSHGVTIEIEGTEADHLAFLRDFVSTRPALAVIDHVQEELLPPAHFKDFQIRESTVHAEAFVLVPSDLATCADCLQELHNPSDRRYRYPFINCTRCGPRYTIIHDIPYDRPLTTMRDFPMCSACEAEYHDPADRRFHAQPNACPQCGPWVELWDRERCLSVREEAIAEACSRLVSGGIVAIKGLGGFHLACVPTHQDAVRKLRERKHRSAKPFAVMARDLSVIESLCQVSEAERAALLSVRRPIVLLAHHTQPLADIVAPGVRALGMMLPYTPLHELLFADASFDLLVMTSANVTEEPLASRNEEVPSRLHGLADFFLIHNRRIHTAVDDSVVRVFEGRERTVRRSRGFAPQPVDLGVPVHDILACGGHLKNVVCLTKEHYAMLSQHIGDLENAETLALFEHTIEHMKSFFRVDPVAVAHDLHPHYLSTRFALALPAVDKVAVQHHHAHIASCMAENHLDGPVIGVAFDGTGYGTDGQIWGGEFLVCDYADFHRQAHFRYVPLAGADTAVRQTWRSALAYLNDAGVESSFLAQQLPVSEFGLVQTMLDRRLNTVLTSSCGRLFDAVAAITGVRLYANYEGQAAMELESLAIGTALPPDEIYPFRVADGEIDFRETVRCLVADRHRPDVAAGRFHNTLAATIVQVCRSIAQSKGVSRVCLSGGTFQNFYLLTRAVAGLRQAGLDVYLHAAVPCNDGGLSLGQAAVANRRLNGRNVARP